MNEQQKRTEAELRQGVSDPVPCRRCGALIFFATTPAGKKAPLDAEPQKRFILEDGVARMVEVYVSHFVTCPNAAEFRQPRPRT